MAQSIQNHVHEQNRRIDVSFEGDANSARWGSMKEENRGRR
jgi:hypothetical protein